MRFRSSRKVAIFFLHGTESRVFWTLWCRSTACVVLRAPPGCVLICYYIAASSLRRAARSPTHPPTFLSHSLWPSLSLSFSPSYRSSGEQGAPSVEIQEAEPSVVSRFKAGLYDKPQRGPSRPSGSGAWGNGAGNPFGFFGL